MIYKDNFYGSLIYTQIKPGNQPRTNLGPPSPLLRLKQPPVDQIRLIDEKEIELVIWINSFNEKKIIINKKIKTVLIGIPTHPQKKDVDIFIPVGTPGLDHNSHLLRIDKVVSLPLKKIRNISLPSVDYVLNKVGQI